MRARKLSLAPIVAMILASALVLSGCSGDENVSAVETTDAAGAVSPPALAEIQAAVTLDADQSATVETALATWSASIASGGQSRFAPAFEKGTRGRRGARGGHMLDFLATITPSLDTAQVEKLVAFFVERREERMAQVRERMKDGKRPHRRDKEDALGLSDEQKAAIAAAREENHKAMQALRERFHNEAITEEEMFTRSQALRDAMHEKMAQILTGEQLAKWNERREQKMKQMVERRLERLESSAASNLDRRAAFLTAVLDLSDATASQLREILAGAVPTERAVLESIRSGQLDPAEGHAQMREAKASTQKAIEGILTDEQVARLTALRPLLPRGPRGGF